MKKDPKSDWHVCLYFAWCLICRTYDFSTKKAAVACAREMMRVMKKHEKSDKLNRKKFNES